MVATNRPDLLQAALKKILKSRGVEVSEGASFNDADHAAWKNFSYEYGIKNGEANQPDYGAMHPILRAWVDSLVGDIEADAESHGLSEVVESKNHPNPNNYLPNVGDGTPEVESDADGNPIYKKVDKEGNPVGISAADQAKIRQTLSNTVPSSADATQTEGLTENPAATGGTSDGAKTLDINAVKDENGEQKRGADGQLEVKNASTGADGGKSPSTPEGAATDSSNPSGENPSTRQAGKEETPAQSNLLGGGGAGTTDADNLLTPNSQPGGARRPDQNSPQAQTSRLNDQSKGGSIRTRTN